jgi:hypothetical protein
MNFSSAFDALGYDLKAPRTDWSAERDNGVCLSLWAKEIKFKDGGCSFDTKRDAMPIESWNHKPGFRRRLEHLRKAHETLGGRIDVVIVSGTPGASYEDAHPWKPEQRKGMAWYVTDFDYDTGHFSAETRPA